MEPGQRLQAVHQAIIAGTPIRELLAKSTSLSSGADPATAVVRYSPPPDTAAFTGRDEELGQITAAMADADRAGGVIAIHAIGGMPGIGKTALAAHAAHRLAHRFPDWQLFIDLHAHTPGQDPLTPATALARLLAATGMDPRFLPEDLVGRAGLWRARMAGQRALLILDNAASSAQVTPLLPGGGDCLVLVTSRRHLGDLPGVTIPVHLGGLPAEQAAQMFTRLAPRAAADPAGVTEVVRLAGYLPLAVSLLARVFARHPSWTLADLAADTQVSLLSLTAENSSIAAAFELSYRHLDPGQRRFFALLGLHPGGTTDSYGAAALTGTTVTQASHMLDRLHAEGLLTETGYRRYGMHDLLRRYARDHAAIFSAEDAERAVKQLLDYYQHAAARAQDILARQNRPSPASAAAVPPHATPTLEDAGQALAWARAERDTLLACLDHVTQTGQHARVITLTAALDELLRRDGPWTQAITRHTTALCSARHLADQSGQATALSDLGTVRRAAGDYPAAVAHQEQALAICRELGERGGEVETLNERGALHRLSGEPAEARTVHQQALELARAIGSACDEARALAGLGRCAAATGHPARARDLLRQAQLIFQRIGAAEAPAVLAELSALTSTGPRECKPVRMFTLSIVER